MNKSLFEQEALRMRELNKHKDEEKVPFWTKVVAVLGGITVAGAAFIFLILPLAFYFTLSSAFVASKLWEWFVMPTFNVGTIRIVPIIGIMMLIRLCTNQHHVNTNKDERTTTEKITHIIGLVISPWFVLLGAYIVHRFM